jgi:serine/threonine protein kinase/tetratricopeptide (TPR) repeat protein
MKSVGVISLVGSEEESAACPNCGSTSRVGRGLCLNCMLYRGFGDETCDGDSLENALDEVEVRDADWRLGNYQILEEIGRGGMGVIYRARQRHSRRIVALKRILAHDAESHDTLVRFRREAEAAASLDHPNILPIYEVSEGEDGLPFFSMKFATGGSLLESQDALRNDTRRAIALMAKVARAVEYAHSRGILHRDLKPGNILLDGRGEPLVCDFGLAKWLDESSDLTRTLTIFGTPGYIAPEQAHGPAANLKPTADVYSLGAILFDLLAGRPPFLGEHALSVIHQAAEKPAPRLRSIVREIDRDLETVCARCLERDPTARYHSAGDVAEDLERWVDGRPVIARPVSPPVRIWRWAKRNPKLAASVAGCALAGVTALAFVMFTFLPDTSPFRPLLTISEKSIAVLPFENLSDDTQNSFFADGVQNEILTNLAKVADLKVISRTSVMQYTSGTARNLREIARALGVAKIVEGSVQRAGDHVKITVQLIDARSDTHLWGTTIDRSLADIFAVQSEVAVNIVGQLKAKLSPAEEAAIKAKPTNDLIAYDTFIRARNLIDASYFSSQPDQGLLEAARLLEEAVARDPTFFRAYCELARAHDILYIYGVDHTPSRVAMADQAIEKAIAINPDAGEVHLARADHLYCAHLDYEAAHRELAIATSLLPNEPRCFELAGFMDRRAGKWEAAVGAFLKALELDPRSIHLRISLSQTYEHMRSFAEKAKILDQATAIAPDDLLARLARAYVDLEWRADPKPLHTAVEQALAKDPTVSAEIAEVWFYVAVCERDWTAARRAMAATNRDVCRTENVAFPSSWCEGFVARAQGDTATAQKAFSKARAEAEKIVREQPNFGEALSVLGLTEAGLGDKQKAIEHGERAVQLVPPSKDAVNGPLLIQYLSLIYSWTGEKDRALAELKRAAALPSPMNYGDLRLHPFWDELRGDPRFEQIVASMAPK